MIDFVFRLPKSLGGNNAVWVILDRLTKSTRFLPIWTMFLLKKNWFLYMLKRLQDYMEFQYPLFQIEVVV